MSIERFVAITTPLFAAVAGALTAWLGKHFPGLPSLNPADVTALMAAGALSASAAALKWLHGRAHYTEIVADADKARAELEHLQQQVAANPTAGPALADIESLLRTHEAQVETVIDEHVPIAVGKALAPLFASLAGLASLGQSAASAPAPVVTTTLTPDPVSSPTAVPPAA